ncbi:DUF5872 domain-containing protein [Sphingomonas lenta]|uniref:DUF5872 domain-containing protein n=1 Tax=Sphingomonas lenta TaxID=1141887 RepID=A0A2A2SJI1_9SPHN|nr:DUF5872 domain-containing protein [Sphingomonas lenta]PAX09383.1 hypothetical protein CKY28_01105 [Sphingomonas lenta]
MSETAEKVDPALWEKVKAEVTAGDKGGKPGQWSARKAQMAVREYEKRGGGYVGPRDDAHNSLHQWTEEEWTTKSGKKSLETGERYLPKKAIEELSDEEYARTSAAKKADLKKGKQFSSQPEDVAHKAAKHRDHRTRAELYELAQKRDIPGRSKMSKDQLREALAS